MFQLYCSEQFPNSYSSFLSECDFKLLPSFFKAYLSHILAGLCMPISCSFLVCSHVPCMDGKNLWPDIQNNICDIFLLTDLQLTYKPKYLNITVIVLLICRGTYTAYIIMRMPSLSFHHRNYINEF